MYLTLSESEAVSSLGFEPHSVTNSAKALAFSGEKKFP